MRRTAVVTCGSTIVLRLVYLVHAIFVLRSLTRWLTLNREIPATADDLPRIVHLACTRLERSLTASVADLESFHIWTSFSSVSDPEASELTMPNPELWTSMTDALDKDRPPRRRVEASESMYAWRSPPTPGTRTHPASKHMVFGNSEGEDPTATPKAGLEPHRLQLSLKMIHADECHSRWPSSPGHSKSVNCPEHGVTRA